MLERTWEVLDYVDHRGTNVVSAWLHGLSDAARNAVDTAIINIEASREPLRRPYVGKLKKQKGKDCADLIELIVPYGGQQFRPIAYYGPNRGQITILAGAEEQNKRFVPEGVCTKAKHRRERLDSNEGRTERHNFSTRTNRR